MVAKVLRIVDVGLALVTVVLGCVALAGVSENKDTIEQVHWSKIEAGNSDAGFEVKLYYNLWGGFAKLDADLDELAKAQGRDPDDLEAELKEVMQSGSLGAISFDDPDDIDYDEKDAMYALVIIGFVFAVFKLIVAGVAVAADNVGVSLGSAALSLLGIAFWFAALGVWVDKVMDVADEEPFHDLTYGPGLGCAAACGSLAVMSLILSIVAFVVCERKRAPPRRCQTRRRDGGHQVSDAELRGGRGVSPTQLRQGDGVRDM